MDALRRHSNLVLQAPPGSGKTTRLPPALVTWGLVAGKVIVLEPRRLAVRAAARWIASEQGWTLGEEVGYQIRFERRAGPRTRLLFVTEGILRRMLGDDPFLDGIDALVFDELHERSLDADLSLALARRVQRDARPELRLVAMSATLDPRPLSAFLGDCPVLQSSGALHPVARRYLTQPIGEPGPTGLVERMVWGVGEALRTAEGDVLAFLPGVGEITRVGERLAERWAAPGRVGPGGSREDDTPLVLPLYGDLPPEQQDAVLRCAPGQRRRVILATNVAETSVTVDGVRVVVDGGYARELRHDPASGLDRLELVRISRQAADQRAGRAGRQSPGTCLRLWTELDDRSLAAATLPEVARVDLAGACLELLAWGEQPETFPWFETPASDRLAAARALLLALGAIDAHGVTPLGRTLARLPLHPRLGRLLINTADLGHASLGALAAAVLSERPSTRRRDGHASSASDLLDLCERATHPVRLLQIRDQLLSLLPAGSRGADRPQRSDWERRASSAAAGGGPRASAPRSRDEAGDPSPDVPTTSNHETSPVSSPASALGRAVLAAYPDRLARRREPGSPRAVLVGGQGVRLADTSAVRDAELFVAVDLDGGRAGDRIYRDGVATHGEALVRIASAVDPAWLPADTVRTTTEATYDPERDRAIGVQRTRYVVAGSGEDTLVLSEKVVPAPPEAVVEALVVAASADLARAVPLDEPALASLLARIRFLAGAMPELALPNLDDASLRELLPGLATGCRSLAELRRAAWCQAIVGLLDHRQRGTLDRHAPERLAVPSGSDVRVDYRGSDGPPILAVRIQEMFGLADTPRLADGRVPVLLHLLAPNGRPQQVTMDLRSFWNSTYAEVRKELAGRYPKHSWPTDPWNAPPQRRPPRRPAG
jgi:ATP-dependent helicase HrpB